MPYSREIDDIIIDLLYKDWDKQSEPRKLGFNQLLVEISRHRNKEISRDILSDHLTRLEQKKIIYREEFKPGVERYSWLTKNAMYARKLGWPIIVNSKRKAKSYRIIYEIIKSNTNKHKISHILFTLFAHNGVVQETPVEYRKEYKIQYSTISIPGFSISDLFYEKRKNIFGVPFNYEGFKDRSEVKQYINTLMKYDPPIIKPLKEIKWILMKSMKVMKGQKCLPLEGETRYGIVDEKLNDFLGELRVLQGWIIMALKEIWIHYKHKPTQEDRAWLEIIYGKKYRLKFFQDILSRKKELKKIGKQKGCQISHVKSVIENTILNVDFIYQNIRENYKDVHESYGIITEALLEEIIYPPFIKRVLEKFKVVLD